MRFNTYFMTPGTRLLVAAALPLSVDALAANTLNSGNTSWILASTADAVTLLFAAVVSFIISKIVSVITKGLRVTEENEIEGLDIALHGERGYDI